MPVERVLPSLDYVEEWPSGWAHTSLQAVITVEFTRAIRIHSELELSTTRPVTSASQERRRSEFRPQFAENRELGERAEWLKDALSESAQFLRLVPREMQELRPYVRRGRRVATWRC